MRFIIYGAGGIGGTLGARLRQAGADVMLIARGAHLAAIQAQGLRLRAPDTDVRLQLPAVGHPRDIQFTPDDVVILCVKSQHTVAALEDLRAAAGDTVPVVCCQNGVANEREALRRFAQVYAMVVVMPALHLEPGEVITHAATPGGVLDLGRYPQGMDARGEAIAAAITSAGFSALPDPKVMRLKYAKLLNNLNNALQAATEMPEGAREISRQLLDEALACYAAAGIDCATVDEMRARRAVIKAGEVAGVPRAGGSSWQSLMRGTGNLETDYLNGEIVLLGRLHGVPTPANLCMQQLGVEMVRGNLKPGAFDLDTLRTRIAQLGGHA